MLKKRKTLKFTSQRKRSKEFCLTANDQVMVGQLEDVIFVMTIQYATTKCPIIKEDKRQALIRLLTLNIGMTMYVDRPLSKLGRMDNSINRFRAMNDEEYCKSMFAFESDELERLHRELKFPEFVKLDNGSVMTGEEVFLRGLYELVSGEKKNAICKTLFGRHPSDQSRAYAYFINYIYDNFKHLVTDNLAWWFRNGYIKESAKAIEAKLGE